MIFSELYSAYYNTVAEILTVAVSGEISEEKLLKTVRNKAFGESVLTVAPALHEERWQLLKTNGEIPVKHIPTMPLTTLEKRWLKSLSADPRIRLFNISFNGLEDVEPLFRPEDFKVYDKYADGDPYSDEEYIKRFRFILSAIRKKQPLKLVAPNRRGQRVELNVCPEKLEYSEKDDKFRLVGTGRRRVETVNLARIVCCATFSGRFDPPAAKAEPPKKRTVEFELYDHNDVKIENSAIRSSEKLIGATMPVSTVKEVPLRVNFVEAVGATMETVDYTISPATVKLVGEKARLDEIDSIVLDTLYVQDLEDSQSLTYTIPVPEDVTIADGVDTATVTVVVRGVTERTLTVSQFTFENVPEGMTATAETESLNVRLRGLTAEVNALTAENVHIVADLSGLTGAGVHTVPVTIRIEGYENIGIKGSYQMVVDLSVTPDEPGQP